MRKALVLGIVLLVTSVVVLGGTVFRQQVADASSLLNVFVTNDSSHPVPVREQNVDANGNIKVHEQGTANVNVTNSGLTVTPKAASAFHVNELTAATGQQDVDQSFSIDASMVTFTSAQGVGDVQLRSGGNTVFDGELATGHDFILPFPQPVPIDEVLLSCDEGPCVITVSVIGN
jgi:hypothetical protein